MALACVHKESSGGHFGKKKQKHVAVAKRKKIVGATVTAATVSHSSRKRALSN